jgi:enamine deaminase RidA (YjgF/YER057c/UK114 family)
MAAFTPIALLKLIPLAEAAVVTAGHQRAALRQATQGATALTTSSSVVSSMIQTRFRSGAATAAAPAAGWAAPAAAAAGALRATGNRATSSFAAMSGVGEVGEVGGESAPPASGRSAPRPSPVNIGGNAGATRRLTVPEMERKPDA